MMRAALQHQPGRDGGARSLTSPESHVAAQQATRLGAALHWRGFAGPQLLFNKAADKLVQY